jgi:putative membrane protein
MQGETALSVQGAAFRKNMPTATSSTKLNPAPRRSASLPIAAIIGVSVVATLFLFWLIYVHPASDAASQHYTFLPNLNALLNGLAAIALAAGYYFVRTHRIAAHRTSMFTAFVFSSLFLVCYIANHALHGDTLYPVHNATYHYAYIPILVSHIVLATLALPIVLITFFLSLSGRIPMHRRVARFTFPLWLYVSVTGVVVRVMLVAALR